MNKETLMWALVKDRPEKGLTLKQVPIPSVGKNDVKIKIHKTAICGTDVHIYEWNDWAARTVPMGLTIGHEYVGEITEIGENVDGFQIGELVSGEGHIVCGKCRNCLAGAKHLCRDTKGVGVNRNGAFANYLVIPAQNVWKCAPAVQEELYACFDPLGNAVHTALSFPVIGEDVLITGAGPIGMMAAAICHHIGARHIVITDRNDYRLSLAKKLGATRCVNIDKEDLTKVMAELNMKEGFDVGLEMSGSEVAFHDMVNHLKYGGKIALLGLLKSDAKIDWSKVIFHGLEIKGIYGREVWETWYKMESMIESGLDIAPVITHHFDVRDYEKGFETMMSGYSGKVILDWTNLNTEYQSDKSVLYQDYSNILASLKHDSLYKEETPIASMQAPHITLSDGRTLLNMCANNYLSLASDEKLIKKAQESVALYGYGCSSVRFICGTMFVHKQLEHTISEFLDKEDTILYSSCFDANGGLFEVLLTEQDAIISDELNHASIIDGIRLCKAKRFRYQNNNMDSLEEQLKKADALGVRKKMIATDGVFSMDGIIANLAAICDLADQYNALVMVDDSHATGFIGATGRGTLEYCGVTSRVDLVSGTFGKALGGAAGGFISGKKELIAMLRQKSRPYLFSNSLPPMIAGVTDYVFHLLSETPSISASLMELTMYYRNRLKEEGFTIIDGIHPIVPILFKDEKKAVSVAQKMMAQGIYVVAFTYPVVPKGKARIRTQLCSSHTKEDIDHFVTCLKKSV